MSNNITGFLERLTAAAGEYNQAKVGTLGALDAVYLDVRPEVARMGQTIRVYLPDVGAFTDQVANDWNPEDLNPSYVDIPFGQRPGKSILVRDFEQFQTSTDIIEQFIDPNYKRAQEYANGAVFGLVNSTNFNSYAQIATSQAQLDISSARLAWNLLVRNKVPIQDAENATILYHPDLHANTLTDTNWYQESLVSAVIAAGTRRDAAYPEGMGSEANTAFKFRRRFDQQAPTSTTALSGTVTTTNASSAITGSGTSFTTAAKVGSWLTFGSDTQSYQVAAVTDDTHLTLGQNYAGSGAAGVAAVRTTYTSIAMHRFAIALAVRPLEIVNDGHIRSRLIMLRGLPMRLMLSYQHLKAGWLMTLDYGMVAKVIRPDFGVVLSS
jgi:hypothetical protein